MNYSLFVGLGGSGCKTVQIIQDRLEKHGTTVGKKPSEQDCFLYLKIDTVIESLQDKAIENNNNDYLALAGNADAESIIETMLGNGPRDFFEKWWYKDSEGKWEIPKLINFIAGAGQVRRYGRLCFAYNQWVHGLVLNKLANIREEMNEWVIKSGHKDANFTVHLFSGTAGGTGSGIVVDMAYLIHHIIRPAHMYGIMFLDDVISLDKEIRTKEKLTLAKNTLRCMTEIDFWQQEATTIPYKADWRNTRIERTNKIFTLTYLVGGHNQSGKSLCTDGIHSPDNYYNFTGNYFADFFQKNIIMETWLINDDAGNGREDEDSKQKQQEEQDQRNEKFFPCVYARLGFAEFELPAKDILNYLIYKLASEALENGFEHRHSMETEAGGSVELNLGTINEDIRKTLSADNILPLMPKTSLQLFVNGNPENFDGNYEEFISLVNARKTELDEQISELKCNPNALTGMREKIWDGISLFADKSSRQDSISLKSMEDYLLNLSKDLLTKRQELLQNPYTDEVTNYIAEYESKSSEQSENSWEDYFKISIFKWSSKKEIAYDEAKQLLVKYARSIYNKKHHVEKYKLVEALCEYVDKAYAAVKNLRLQSVKIREGFIGKVSEFRSAMITPSKSICKVNLLEHLDELAYIDAITPEWLELPAENITSGPKNRNQLNISSREVYQSLLSGIYPPALEKEGELTGDNGVMEYVKKLIYSSNNNESKKVLSEWQHVIENVTYKIAKHLITVKFEPTLNVWTFLVKKTLKESQINETTFERSFTKLLKTYQEQITPLGKIKNSSLGDTKKWEKAMITANTDDLRTALDNSTNVLKNDDTWYTRICREMKIKKNVGDDKNYNNKFSIYKVEFSWPANAFETLSNLNNVFENPEQYDINEPFTDSRYVKWFKERSHRANRKEERFTAYLGILLGLHGKLNVTWTNKHIIKIGNFDILCKDCYRDYLSLASDEKAMAPVIECLQSYFLNADNSNKQKQETLETFEDGLLKVIASVGSTSKVDGDRKELIRKLYKHTADYLKRIKFDGFIADLQTHKS